MERSKHKRNEKIKNKKLSDSCILNTNNIIAKENIVKETLYVLEEKHDLTKVSVAPFYSHPHPNSHPEHY